jgi:hypothetical protein
METFGWEQSTTLAWYGQSDRLAAGREVADVVLKPQDDSHHITAA